MKKIFCLLVCIALALATAITSYAATNPYNSPNDTEVTKTIYSRCNISIPEAINLNMDCSLPITITDAEIIDGEKVKVRVSNLNNNGAISLYNTDNSEMDVYLLDNDKNRLSVNNPYLAKLDKSYFDSLGTGTISCDVVSDINDSDVDVGVYSGIIQYQVEINNFDS